MAFPSFFSTSFPVRRSLCACCERLSDDLGCLACGKQYEKVPEGLFEKDRKI